MEGGAVRRRYSGGTNGGIPARSARMTAKLGRRSRYPGGTNEGILRSLTLPLNDVRSGECAAGCGGDHWRGAAVTWTRRPKVSVIQRAKPVESPSPRLGREPSEADRGRKGGARERTELSPQGGSGVKRTLRRRRGNAVRYRYPCRNQPGDSSPACAGSE